MRSWVRPGAFAARRYPSSARRLGSAYHWLVAAAQKTYWPSRIIRTRSCAPAPPSPTRTSTTYENGVSFVDYLLEGELTLWVGDDTRTLHPGEFVFAPRQVPHTIRVGDDGARWLVIAGGRFEAFVRTVAAIAGEPSPIELTRIAAKHGIELLGPPGMLPTQLAA